MRRVAARANRDGGSRGTGRGIIERSNNPRPRTHGSPLPGSVRPRTVRSFESPSLISCGIRRTDGDHHVRFIVFLVKFLGCWCGSAADARDARHRDGVHRPDHAGSDGTRRRARQGRLPRLLARPRPSRRARGPLGCSSLIQTRLPPGVLRATPVPAAALRASSLSSAALRAASVSSTSMRTSSSERVQHRDPHAGRDRDRRRASLNDLRGLRRVHSVATQCSPRA